MRKFMYVLLFVVVVVSGRLFTHHEGKNEDAPKPVTRVLSAAERTAAVKKWEASPDGRMYTKWKSSAAGKKVFAGTAKIKESIRNFTSMEGVVTSLSLPPGSRLGYGIMIRIKDDDFILAFGPEGTGKGKLNFPGGFEQLRGLKVNDKIVIRSHGVSHAPKYAYPIIAGDHVARNGAVIYERPAREGGC